MNKVQVHEPVQNKHEAKRGATNAAMASGQCLVCRALSRCQRKAVASR